MTPRWRRRYTVGRACQDCGRHRPATWIMFWATGYWYRVCGECIRAYRGVICTHTPSEPPAGAEHCR